MDGTVNNIPALLLRIQDGESERYSAFCSHIADVSYGGYDFVSAVEIDYSKIAPVKVDFDSEDCSILNIPAAIDTLAGEIYDRLPYGRIEVIIFEFELEDDFSVVSAKTIWKGLIYKSKSSLAMRMIDIELKDDKYYYDKTAGVVCTEQCGVAFFGDDVCGVIISPVNAVVESIDGTVLTLTDSPDGGMYPYRYNNGYVEYNGLKIKITYWQDGASLNLASTPPASWIGATVKVVAGCGRDIASCRRYQNEVNFLGLGYSMVNYNAVYEED